MEFIDSHCHPHFENYASDADKVIEAAEKLGVKKIIAVGTTLQDSERAVQFASARPNIWATAGVHPHDAAAWVKNNQAINRLTKILDSSSIVAVGEIGLDYYKNFSSKQDQIKTLRQQIDGTIDLNLPYVFHVRDAWDDFWPIFDSYPNLTGVIHSFSTDIKQLDQVLSRNLFVGLNGIMTFTNDQSQLEAAKAVPASSLLIETDAPFLTPKPFRGERCEPKHVINVAEFLAQLRGEELRKLAAQTAANAVSLFSLESK